MPQAARVARKPVHQFSRIRLRRTTCLPSQKSLSVVGSIPNRAMPSCEIGRVRWPSRWRVHHGIPICSDIIPSLCHGALLNLPTPTQAQTPPGLVGGALVLIASLNSPVLIAPDVCLLLPGIAVLSWAVVLFGGVKHKEKNYEDMVSDRSTVRRDDLRDGSDFAAGNFITRCCGQC
jgi:hypothetical protein